MSYKIAIIQARMGSSRLPGKSLVLLGGIPVIDWVVSRCSMSKLIDKVVVAIPETSTDDPLADYLKSKGVCVYRGSENNVLRRFYGVSSEYKKTILVRVCADRPLVCPLLIDEAIEHFINHSCDLAYNHRSDLNSRKLIPFGFGVEVFSTETFNRYAQERYTDYESEHITPKYYSNEYKSDFVKPKIDIERDGKFDLDDILDFKRLKFVVSQGFSISHTFYDFMKGLERYDQS
jgi:spore coat polysaccharide biosynthesis protein SpsF